MRKSIVTFICIFIFFIGACSDKAHDFAGFSLDIRSGMLYVILYDGHGSTYRTTIEADDMEVKMPDWGKGTIMTISIIKDKRTVLQFTRSYVDGHMTKEEAEDRFGPLTRVLSPFQIGVIVICSIILSVILLSAVLNLLGKKKKSHSEMSNKTNQPSQ